MVLILNQYTLWPSQTRGNLVNTQAKHVPLVDILGHKSTNISVGGTLYHIEICVSYQGYEYNYICSIAVYHDHSILHACINKKKTPGNTYFCTNTFVCHQQYKYEPTNVGMD